MAVPKYFRPAFLARSARPGAGLGGFCPVGYVGDAATKGIRVRARVAFMLARFQLLIEKSIELLLTVS